MIVSLKYVILHDFIKFEYFTVADLSLYPSSIDLARRNYTAVEKRVPLVLYWRETKEHLGGMVKIWV